MKYPVLCAKVVILLALFMFMSSLNAHAQLSATAQLTGQVIDTQGAVVANATVQIIDTERNNVVTAITDGNGRYTLANLEVAPYRLEVARQGFKKLIRKNIVLHVGDKREIDVTLSAGRSSESEEVTVGANLVQTEQSSVSQIISRKSILELPLNGRQTTQLVLISGASVVTPAGDLTSTKSYPSSTSISVAGSQGNGVHYLLDGGISVDTMTNVNLPLPFPDALQEFGVETSVMPAQNGYQPGGLVTVVTKAGANAFHGNLFEFVRNGIFNAQNRFSTTPDTLKRNQFGGTIGGKILRDKLFFFGGYQGTRQVSQPGNTFAYVPTAQELLGNFSIAESAACQSSGKAHAPLAGYSNNQIPVTQFDASAVKFLKYLPASTDPCGRVSFGIKAVLDENQYIGRIDWIQNSKHTAFGRHFYTNYNNPGAYSPTNLLVSVLPGIKEAVNEFTYGDSYRFTPRLQNSFHGTFTRRGETRGNAPSVINPTDVGIAVYAPIPNDFHLTVGSDFVTGCNTCSTARFGITTFELAEDLEYFKGNHHMAFGASIVRTDLNINNAFYSNGQYAFNGTVTGDAMADFLLGSMSSFTQSKGQQNALRDSILAPYFQDTVRLGKRLVLTAGLRWEPQIFVNDYFHRGGSFSLANFEAGTRSIVFPTAPAGAVYHGDPGVPTNFVNSSWLNLAPRVGLAWDIFGSGREMLRVGGGVAYNAAEIFAASRLLNDPPAVSQVSLATSNPGGFSNPWTTGYNYPGGNPYPITTSFFPTEGTWVYAPPSLKPTKMDEWNLTYQQQVGNDWVFSASYIGNRTNHLWAGQETDPAIYSSSVCAQFVGGCTTKNTNQRRMLYQINPAAGQYYSSVLRIDDGANANYDGLLVSANHRLTRGVSVLANYTWSHCTSNTDFVGDIQAPGYMNPADPAADKASCSFDIRHILNGSVVQTVGPSGHSLVDKAVGQWQLAPLVRMISGIPLNVLTGTDQSLTGVGLDRPNYSTTASPYASTSNKLQYLSALAFTPNAPGTFGNVGKNAFRGPDALNFDIGVTRLFTVMERFQGEFRCDAFNVINKVNLIAPATSTGIPGISPAGINLTLSSPTFGQISSSGDPRIVQLAMKVSF
jgi:hypothetical protein